MLIPVLFHLYFSNRMASGETSERDLIPPLFCDSSKRHLAGRFKSVIDKDDSSYFARVALPARSHRLGCPNLVYMAYFPALSLLSATDSAYSWLIPCLLLPYFWTLAFCSIFCLFLPYSYLIPALFSDFSFLQHILLIPALFLPYS